MTLADELHAAQRKNADLRRHLAQHNTHVTVWLRLRHLQQENAVLADRLAAVAYLRAPSPPTEAPREEERR